MIVHLVIFFIFYIYYYFKFLFGTVLDMGIRFSRIIANKLSSTFGGLFANTPPMAMVMFKAILAYTYNTSEHNQLKEKLLGFGTHAFGPWELIFKLLKCLSLII